jgi:hypothetical protein
MKFLEQVITHKIKSSTLFTILIPRSVSNITKSITPTKVSIYLTNFNCVSLLVYHITSWTTYRNKPWISVPFDNQTNSFITCITRSCHWNYFRNIHFNSHSSFLVFLSFYLISCLFLFHYLLSSLLLTFLLLSSLLLFLLRLVIYPNFSSCGFRVSQPKFRPIYLFLSL